MSAQPFRSPYGGLRNALGDLLCGYVGRDAANGPFITSVCMQLDPCPDHGAQDPDHVGPTRATIVTPADMADPRHLLGQLPEAAPALDLHQQLKDDDQPWSVRRRLTVILGRPALATRLADALAPALGAELADRLDTIVTQALTEQQAAITQELSDRYHEARARLDADAAAKLKEVHDERYRNPSRLS